MSNSTQSYKIVKRINMLFYINLILLLVTYGTGCPPCECFNNLLICHGLEVQSFPTLSSAEKEVLKRVEIVNTRISCIPTIIENEYGNLATFIEENNRIFNCTCLESWFKYLPADTTIKTNCSQDIETTFLPDSTSSYITYHSSSDTSSTHPTSTLSVPNRPFTTVSLNSTMYTNIPVTVPPPTNVSQGVIILSILLIGLLVVLSILLIVHRLKIRGYCFSKVNSEIDFAVDGYEFEFIGEDSCEIIFEQTYSVV